MQQDRASRYALLEKTATAAEILRGAVETSFGPFGGDQLVVGETGRMVICNNGRSVLRGIDGGVKDPMTRYILNSVCRFEERYGDGSSGLVIVLSAMFRELYSAHGLTSKRLKAFEHGIRSVRQGFQNDGYSAWFDQGLIYRVQGDIGELVPWIERVVRTNLNGQFAPTIENDMAKLLCDWIKSSVETNPCRNIVEILDEMVRHFTSFCIVSSPTRISGLSVVSNGTFFVDRPALHRLRAKSVSPEVYTSCLQKEMGTSTAKFLILTCPLSPFTPDSNQSVLVSDKEKMIALAMYRSRRVEETVRKILQLIPNLSLVVSTEEIEDPAMELLLANGCVGVQQVPKAQASQLSRLCGKDVIHDIRDLDTKNLVKFVCTCENVVEVHLGGTSYAIRISGIETSSDNVGSPICPQFHINTMSSAIADQYKLALERALKLVRMWLADVDRSLIIGGCAFEIRLFHYLTEQAILLKESASEKTFVFETLAAAVAQVPVTLLRNENLDVFNPHTISLLRSVQRSERNSHIVINSEECARICCFKTNLGNDTSLPVEPFSLRLAQFCYCLEIIEQLLRIDHIYKVSRVISLEVGDSQENDCDPFT